MKNVLLIVALTASMHVLAQNLPSTSGKQYQISNLKDNPRAGTQEEVVGIYGTIQHQIPVQLSSFQQNDSIYTWNWDSEIAEWTVESKIINIAYDDSLNVVFYIRQIWDGSAWMNASQQTFTYDAKNNLISRIGLSWVCGAWVNSTQNTYTYDAHNNKTSELLIGAGPFSYRFTWTYDENDNKLSEFYETMWSDYLNTYTYDSKNNIISEVHQEFDGGTDYYKWKYLYDSKNNRIKATHQQWNGNDWVTDFYYRYLYTYDSSRNITSEIVQLTKAPDLYLNVNKFTYTYDAKNNLTSEIKQGWENGYWVNIDQYNFTYDDSSNLVSKYSGGWLGSAWVYYLQDLFTFDAQNNLTSHIFQQLNGTTWKMGDQWLYTYEDNNFKTSESHKHFDLNAPEPVVTDGDSTHYYFHTITTAINDVKEDDGSFKVYPNPSCGKFTISSESAIRAIEIYNLLGERVYSDSQFEDQSSKDIDLSDQGPGIYIINIADGKLMYNRKVVVQ